MKPEMPVKRINESDKDFMRISYNNNVWNSYDFYVSYKNTTEEWFYFTKNLSWFWL